STPSPSKCTARSTPHLTPSKRTPSSTLTGPASALLLGLVSRVPTCLSGPLFFLFLLRQGWGSFGCRGCFLCPICLGFRGFQCLRRGIGQHCFRSGVARLTR